MIEILILPVMSAECSFRSRDDNRILKLTPQLGKFFQKVTTKLQFKWEGGNEGIVPERKCNAQDSAGAQAFSLRILVERFLKHER